MLSPPPWPAFQSEWLLYRDQDLVVVHKPVGVPSQRQDAEVADELPSRLTEFLVAEGGAPITLGVHQRLDQDTSGVMLYSLSSEAKSNLHHAFEAREVEQAYTVLVVGGRPPEGLMEDHLRSGKGSRMEVVPATAGGAKLARSQVEVLEVRGSRRLLEVRIEKGGTHQLRAQLAHRGCTVAGDTLYGGAPAPRLMLHAQRLTLKHPRTGEPLTVESHVPAEFEALLRGASGLPHAEALAQALDAATQRRYALGHCAVERGAVERGAVEPGVARAPRTTAFRWVNGAGDGLPGLKLDIFGDHVVVHLYGEQASEREAELLTMLERAGWAGVYVKRRPKKASGLSPEQRAALTPREPAFGTAAATPLRVYEDDVPFDVELGGSFGVGLFLDQRRNRGRVRTHAQGRAMLNLFAHTCSFSVAAALGGALSTLSVDASRSALERGRANLEAAGVDPQGHRFLKEDAFVLLGRLARRGERFGLVVVDPPTYSTTRARRWKSGEGWVDLSRACFEICAPEALVLATTNDTRLSDARFRRHLHQGARDAGRTVAQMKSLPLGRDFPGSDSVEPGARSLWIRLGD